MKPKKQTVKYTTIYVSEKNKQKLENLKHKYKVKSIDKALSRFLKSR